MVLVGKECTIAVLSPEDAQLCVGVEAIKSDPNYISPPHCTHHCVLTVCARAGQSNKTGKLCPKRIFFGITAINIVFSLGVCMGRLGRSNKILKFWPRRKFSRLFCVGGRRRGKAIKFGNKFAFLLTAQTLYLPSYTYLIFVISFTQAGILNTNILHPKITKTPKNYNK